MARLRVMRVQQLMPNVTHSCARPSCHRGFQLCHAGVPERVVEHVPPGHGASHPLQQKFQLGIATEGTRAPIAGGQWTPPLCAVLMGIANKSGCGLNELTEHATGLVLEVTRAHHCIERNYVDIPAAVFIKSNTVKMRPC